MIKKYTIIAFVQLFTLFAPLTSYSYQNESGYYFDRKPFIHPKIINDLLPWMSDSGEQIVSINLSGSADTNRYYGPIETNNSNNPLVSYTEDRSFFGYRLLGTTDSGVSALLISERGGGSGVFLSVLLVSIVSEYGYASYNHPQSILRMDRKRWVIKKLGMIHLGDRYSGELKVVDNSLFIGKDQYFKSAGLFPEDTMIYLGGTP